jgi:hypothetical protein
MHPTDAAHSAFHRTGEHGCGAMDYPALIN